MRRAALVLDAIVCVVGFLAIPFTLALILPN